MKRLLITTTGFLVLGLFVFLNVHVSKANSVQNNSNTTILSDSTASSSQSSHVPIDHSALQKKFGMVINPSSIKPTIAEDQIKTIATKFPEYKLTQNVSYELVQMTYPKFNAFSQSALSKNPKLKNDGQIKELPVWLVSFQGLNIPSMNNSKKTIYDHETIYIIDATSGEMLLGLNYR